MSRHLLFYRLAGCEFDQQLVVRVDLHGGLRRCKRTSRWLRANAIWEVGGCGTSGPVAAAPGWRPACSGGQVYSGSYDMITTEAHDNIINLSRSIQKIWSNEFIVYNIKYNFYKHAKCLARIQLFNPAVEQWSLSLSHSYTISHLYTTTWPDQTQPQSSYPRMHQQSNTSHGIPPTR